MRISRVRLKNFANFSDVDIETGDSIVIVGENKVGKSNFIRALQLIFDPGLSERDRQLGFEHFWDGLGESKLGETVEVSVELTDFMDEPRLIAHLADHLVQVEPMTARLTYRFQPRTVLKEKPKSLSDYEYIIFGGKDPEAHVDSSLRRMLPMDVQGALRDAEKDLTSWRRSPLRPIIDNLAVSLDEEARTQIQEQVDQAQQLLSVHEEVAKAAKMISDKLNSLAGSQHAVSIKLGLAPARMDSLLRSLLLLIDNGSRGIGDASLGTANLIFLALKSLELDRSVSDQERDHSFFVVEEPEAHLHPHVQRLVYRYFLGNVDCGKENSRSMTTILTTHSPHIASVAPIRSIVLLRHDAAGKKTEVVSTAKSPFSAEDEKDLQRYIDVNRGEIFFSRGVILVEGDAERFLVPAFANALNIPLDILGISVCSVSGTNFTPYVKLLGSNGLNIPHVILTDYDPVEGKKPRVHRRLASVLDVIDPGNNHGQLKTDDLLYKAQQFGCFVNNNTLELELFYGGASQSMHDVIRRELPSLNEKSFSDLRSWVNNIDQLDEVRLLAMIERIGKGRFAQALAELVSPEVCPEYIRKSLEYIRNAIH